MSNVTVITKNFKVLFNPEDNYLLVSFMDKEIGKDCYMELSNSMNINTTINRNSLNGFTKYDTIFKLSAFFGNTATQP